MTRYAIFFAAFLMFGTAAAPADAQGSRVIKNLESENKALKLTVKDLQSRVRALSTLGGSPGRSRR